MESRSARKMNQMNNSLPHQILKARQKRECSVMHPLLKTMTIRWPGRRNRDEKRLSRGSVSRKRRVKKQNKLRKVLWSIKESKKNFVSNERKKKIALKSLSISHKTKNCSRDLNKLKIASETNLEHRYLKLSPSSIRVYLHCQVPPQTEHRMEKMKTKNCNRREKLSTSFM